MIDLRAARRYSQALYGLAQSAGTLDAVDNELEAAAAAFKKTPGIIRVLSNSTISIAEKELFVVKAAPEGTSQLVLSFLKVLIKKKRIAEFAGVQKEFHNIYEKNRNVEEVTAVTAVPLSPENASKLQAVLAKKLKSDVRLIQKTDPKIIGGLVIRYAGNEINGSYRSRLNAVEQILNSL